jgi:stearoyl-CoA desaturase (delta-9 desaturase)
VALAVGGYVLRMWALTAGYHRYFSHRAYRTSRVFHVILAMLGATAMQNGPIWWASWHRRHHRFADRPGDPHSPVLNGFWHAHVGWVFDGRHTHPDFENVNDLTALPELRVVERFNKLLVLLYAGATYAIAGAAGVVWGFVVSTVVLAHFTFFINSLAHVWRSRRYVTGDQSRNNPLLAIVMLGEGWHNNHHHYMSSARQGFFWWEFDFSYYTLVVLSWLRLVRDVRQPTELALTSDLVTAPAVAEDHKVTGGPPFRD